MLLRLMVILGAAAFVAGQGKLPLATFNGTLHGVSSKRITIENEDGNLVDFEIDHKTQAFRDKKQIHLSGLVTGDTVVIEARQQMGARGVYLLAVTITAQAKQQ
jgi:Cu/Ag efflux protein CusF